MQGDIFRVPLQGVFGGDIELKRKRGKITPFALVVLPIILLVASLGIGRFPVSLDTVFGILGSHVFPIEPTWAGGGRLRIDKRV